MTDYGPDESIIKNLAAILRTAQGVIDKDTGKDIDIGGYVADLRRGYDRLYAQLAEAQKDAEHYLAALKDIRSSGSEYGFLLARVASAAIDAARGEE